MDIPRQSEPVDAGQVERFMALYSGHQRRLYLYALTLLPVSVDAEDVLQEANLVLWRKFSQYRPESNFFAWACSIIRYEVLKYREKLARTAALLDPDVLDRLADVAVAQVEHLDESHRRALVDCTAELSAADRDLMRQRYAAGMAVQDMAAALNRSPNAVSKSLGRIRRLLLECINNAIDDQQRAEKGTGPICAKHPPGRSGKLDLSPFLPPERQGGGP
jgi:RNA polymerase sigma-70 factor, ECF subfamily